jgi:hypothetical protein
VKKGYLLPATQTDSMQHVPDYPVPTAFWSGAFSFARSKTMQRVPFDPHLSYVHTGEGVYMAARLFTHGCSLFHPTRSYVGSMKDSGYRHLVFDRFTPKQQKERTKAYRRMHMILGLGVKHLSQQVQQQRYNDPSMTEDVHLYGLGPERSLDDYFLLSGLSWSDMGHCRIKHNASMGVTGSAKHEELMSKHGVLFLEQEQSPFTK